MSAVSAIVDLGLAVVEGTGLPQIQAICSVVGEAGTTCGVARASGPAPPVGPRTTTRFADPPSCPRRGRRPPSRRAGQGAPRTRGCSCSLRHATARRRRGPCRVPVSPAGARRGHAGDVTQQTVPHEVSLGASRCRWPSPCHHPTSSASPPDSTTPSSSPSHPTTAPCSCSAPTTAPHPAPVPPPTQSPSGSVSARSPATSTSPSATTAGPSPPPPTPPTRPTAQPEPGPAIQSRTGPRFNCSAKRRVRPSPQHRSRILAHHAGTWDAYPAQRIKGWAAPNGRSDSCPAAPQQERLDSHRVGDIAAVVTCSGGERLTERRPGLIGCPSGRAGPQALTVAQSINPRPSPPSASMTASAG